MKNVIPPPHDVRYRGLFFNICEFPLTSRRDGGVVFRLLFHGLAMTDFFLLD